MAFWQQVHFGNNLLQYLYFFGTIAIAILAGKIIAWVSENVARKKAKNTKTHLDEHLIDTIEKPLVFLLFVLGLYFGQNFLFLSARMSEILGNVVSMLITIDGAWFLMNASDAILTHYIKPFASKTESDLDDHLLPLSKKLAKFVIIAITLVMIIDNFGYDVTSLIAGLGLGGLAFALAAKDLLGNLFGGVAIATDRPFTIGDRIRLDDENDGHVREIGLRTTRIQKLDGRMVTIPNSKLVDSIVENVSSEPARRVLTHIGVEYGTSAKKMEKGKQILKQVFKDVDGVRDEGLVSFWEFGDSALKYLVIYWIEDTDRLFEIKNEVNMEIKKRFEKAKISMAFPTRTVHLEK